MSFDAENSLFKFDGDVFAQVGAALGTRDARRPPPPNRSPKPKNSPKMSLKSWKTVGSKPAPPRHRPRPRARSDRRAALFRIGENRVRLAAFFEFFFRIGIVGIAVRMELQRQLAIGALDLLIGRPTLHTQEFRSNLVLRCLAEF